MEGSNCSRKSVAFRTRRIALTDLTPYFCTRSIYLVDSHSIARFVSSLTIFCRGIGGFRQPFWNGVPCLMTSDVMSDAVAALDPPAEFRRRIPLLFTVNFRIKMVWSANTWPVQGSAAVADMEKYLRPLHLATCHNPGQGPDKRDQPARI